jgi:DNA-binding transcriptional LysR family regulator
MRILNLEQLRAFVAVVDERGFTAAAPRVNRTQSAVSMQVKALEDSLGRRLLVRGRGGVAPTPEGEAVLGYARRLLALNDEAVAALSGEALRGAVRLGTPDDYAAVFLPGVVARFAASHPQVEVEIQCALSTDLMQRLEAGALDLALVTREPGRPGGTLVRRERLVWAAAAGYRPELRDPLPLALFPEGCLFRPAALDALDAARQRWRIAYTSGSLAGIHSAVAAGLAVTCLAAATVPAGLRLLGRADGMPALPTVEIALRRAARMTPAAAALAHHLVEALSGTASRAA